MFQKIIGKNFQFVNIEIINAPLWGKPKDENYVNVSILFYTYKLN